VNGTFGKGAVLFFVALAPCAVLAVTNTVSRPVGILNATISESNSVLLSLPFDPFDDGIAQIFDGYLTGGLTVNDSDQVLKWDAQAQAYETYWQDLLGIWKKDPELLETTNTLRPGEGFWIVTQDGNGTQTVYFVGDVILAPTNAVTLLGDTSDALNLFSLPFSSKLGLNATDLANDGAAGAAAQTNADEVTDTILDEQFFLFDNGDTNHPAYRKWVDANTNIANVELLIGQGYWYNRRVTNALSWTEARPYADLFPANTNPPIVNAMSINAQGDEVTLEIEVTGESGELIEIYYKDLT